MTLLRKQRQFRGLTFGAGTDIRVKSEEGLEGFTVRDGDLPLPRDDGSIPGLHTVESKQIQVDLIVRGDVPANLAAVMAAFAPSRSEQFQYRFVNDSDELFVRARPKDVRLRRDAQSGVGTVMEVTAVLKAADPRIYSSELFSELVPLFGGSGGGAVFPGEFPFGMGAATQNLATAVNSGFRDAFPTIQFQHVSGTVTGVELSNLTTGSTLTIETVIAAGQVLTADMDALVRATGSPVIHIGGASRYGDWQPPRTPFYLAPGSNTLRFELSGGGSAVCLVSWRSTS